MERKNIGILLMAGKSTRMNGVNKQFYVSAKDNLPVFYHPLSTMCDALDTVYIVASQEGLKEAKAYLNAWNFKSVKIVVGGLSRSESVKNAIRAIEKDFGNDEINVYVHDAARPFVPKSIFVDEIALMENHDAVTPILKTCNSLIKKEGNGITYIPRNDVYEVQTPQAFHLDVLRRGYEKIGDECKTDDFQLILGIAKSPVTLQGSCLSFKITEEDDLNLYERLLG